MAKSAEPLTVRMLMDEERTILLVDDSEDDLLLMRLAFQRAGFKAVLRVVRDGEEAIAYLEGEPPYNDRACSPFPTLVLLDLNMPKKNGFEVLEWVRAQPDFRYLPIVVLTSSMRAGDVEEAFNLGVNSFLVKPAKMEDLVEMIRCLGGWLRINHFPSLHGAVAPSLAVPAGVEI